MGDKGSDNDAAKDAGKIAKRLWSQTNPARESILDRGTEFLRGGFDPASSPVWDPTKQVLESQYQNARQNAIANMPTGGALQDVLANIEMGRANQIGQLGADISMDEYNKIYGAAMGAPQTTLSGLAGVASSQAAEQAALTGGIFGALGGIGSGVGEILGGKK